MTDDEPSADLGSGWGDIRHKREEIKENLTESDLEKQVELVLQETETIWLLDMPGVCVSAENEEADSIRERNQRYIELSKSRAGNDRYVEKGMNTFNEPYKFKTIQTQRVTYSDAGVMATNWDMYDTYAAEEDAKKGSTDEEEEDHEGTISRPISETKTGSGEETTRDRARLASARSKSSGRATLESRGTMVSSTAGTESLFTSKDTGVTAVYPDAAGSTEESILQSDRLKKDLFFMERVVNLNSYQSKQASFRGFSTVEDIDKEKSEAVGGQISVADMGPNLDRLWSYNCPLTKGRNVSCLSWNSHNQDLIAVGYGQYDFTRQKPGLVCCWSLKNPEYPERTYTFSEGVTALDFSKANPNLLVVGLYNGGVAIFNVRSTTDEPIIDNFSSPGKHTAPIWQLHWIEKERGSGEERAEVLVSVSTDGRITQWSIRKGFESYDLMKLKRLPTRMQGSKNKEKKGEAFISRHAGGFCVDFQKHDTNIYLAGTEEGHIHKCSCSYNEQYLESYNGHAGPVYKVLWSPFVPDLFLSCSADWSIRMWHQDQISPILSFFSSTKSVFDICWSPRSSVVFACVNEAAVEVWDLSVSTLDPVIVYTPVSGARLTSVTFAMNSECLLVGDSEGQVTVYQLRCMAPYPDKQAEELQKVISASLATQLKRPNAFENSSVDSNMSQEFFD
ncbi:dynein axonemal intermediate chain 4-like [Liolophura sinensis]|uniref:dynein axonemal intermediate chain 4-like n=1 Tax=Liolophura sinensis TaxID=3198878 RepID=UPI003158D803